MSCDVMRSDLMLCDVMHSLIYSAVSMQVRVFCFTRSKILHCFGFDLVNNCCSMGEILKHTGNSPGSLAQGILVWKTCWFQQRPYASMPRLYSDTLLSLATCHLHLPLHLVI